MLQNDTIVAIATAPGRGGIGIIRISGNNVLSISKILLKFYPKNRYAHFCKFYDQKNNIIDEGIALYFSKPNSFTGEHILELHAHSNPIILDKLIAIIINTKLARIANPGEFTERAFLNNKIDLTQAEAIIDLINANSEQATKSALYSMQGEFSKKINILLQNLINLRMHVESSIDFSEEDIDFIENPKIIEKLDFFIQKIEEILSQSKTGILLKEGLYLSIIGKPNAGKSSLLNALSGRESSIVTKIEGTTRDIIRENILIKGIPIHIVDTAGIRDSNNLIEKKGIQKALIEIKKSNHILLVIDIQKERNHQKSIDEICSLIPHNIPITIILNKCDLLNLKPKFIKIRNKEGLIFSTKKNVSLEMLRKHLLKTVGYNQTVEGNFLARRRHILALENVKNKLLKSKKKFLYNPSIDLLAEDLRKSQDYFNEILGKFTSDDLLKKIFSEFCIGK